MRWFLFLAVTSICLAPSSLWSVIAYPEWFLSPYKYPDVITGYSYNGLSAREDAVHMLAAYSDCIVKGPLEIFDYPHSNDVLKNSNYYYWFSQESADSLRPYLLSLGRYDTDLLTRDYIEAFALDSLSLDSVPVLNVQEIKPPKWLNQTFFEGAEYYYGIGMYTSMGRDNDAWKTAEEQAVFAILTNLAVNVHNIKILAESEEPQEGFTDISFLGLFFHLQNIEIVQRYPDNRSQLFYVLARIRKSNVRSPLLK